MAAKVVSPAPLISIVIACFNAGRTIDEAISSIVPQLGTRAELVVIDGGSIDGTAGVIERHADQIAYSASEPDKGIYDAWNKGVRASRGLYIAFVGADDVLLPGALDAYARLIASNPEAEYLSSRAWYGSEPGARMIGEPWGWKRFRRFMCVAHVGSMHRRSLYERVGLYDDSFAITGDYELLLRAGSALRTAYLSEPTVRMGVGGISSGNASLVFEEAARAKRLHSGLSEWVVTRDRLRAIIGLRLRRWVERLR